MGEYQPIENYGIVGDLHTVALVGMDGSVDFMSFPHFDSPTVFGALLDAEKGGCFKLCPRLHDGTQKQIYLPDTNVLITRSLASSGVAEVSDFMPVGVNGAHHCHALVRRAKCVRGEVGFDLLLDPRFDYGRADHKVEQRDGEILFHSQGDDGIVLRLRTEVPLDVTNGTARGSFTLRAGETAAFVLEQAMPGVESPSAAPDYVPDSFKETVNFWRNWIGHSHYTGRWRETVNRSALLLKLLVSNTHGSLVAAPTCGLPEEIGGERNWDYRYCWVRDSTVLLTGLAALGHFEEAMAFADWIVRTTAGRADEIQIMYGIGGERLLHEAVLPHLSGYRGSSPVRVGNGAWDQLQIDTYGELVATAWFVRELMGASAAAGEPRPADEHLATFAREIVETAIARFDEPDEGIWEVRGGRQHFLFSKLMSWLCVDCAIKLTEANQPDDHERLARWRETRAAMRRRIETEGVDPETGAFTQALGSTALDATALQVGLRGFLPFDDSRVVATVEQIDRDLTRNGHVFRYRGADGLAGGEGTFVFCTLWLVSALAYGGQIERAEERLDLVLGCASDLGLLAEEIDADTGELLGNFPQAFSHVGVIAAALAIAQARAAT